MEVLEDDFHFLHGLFSGSCLCLPMRRYHKFLLGSWEFVVYLFYSRVLKYILIVTVQVDARHTEHKLI